MHPDSFDPKQLARGSKYSLDLEFTVGDHALSIPLIVFRGAGEGKTLVVMAGVHGDEYEGVRAILEVCATLNPADMAGDLIVVPVANPTAHRAGTRTSPLDGRDLARTFPGDPNSSPTCATAYYLGKAVIARADLFVDLHSGGVKYSMPTMAGYDTTDLRARDAARAFGTKVLWGHPVTPPGRTISFAKDCGIPAIYTEAYGAGRIAPEDLRVFKRGIINLLAHLSILPAQPAAVPVEYHLQGNANTDLSMQSTRGGFLITCVGLLEKVKKGKELGRIVDLHGNTIETFLAPEDGLVGMIREFPAVEAGTELYLLTSLEAQN